MLRFALADFPFVCISLYQDMEAIMALPYKTGGQNGIGFIEYCETRPAGVKNAIDIKSFIRFAISSVVLRQPETPLHHCLL